MLLLHSWINPWCLALFGCYYERRLKTEKNLYKLQSFEPHWDMMTVNDLCVFRKLGLLERTAVGRLWHLLLRMQRWMGSKGFRMVDREQRCHLWIRLPLHIIQRPNWRMSTWKARCRYHPILPWRHQIQRERPSICCGFCRTRLHRYRCQSLVLPGLQLRSILRALLLILQLGPRRVGCRVRKHKHWQRLLDREKQLGHWLGTKWLHLDGSKRQQQLWYRFWCYIPYCVNSLWMTCHHLIELHGITNGYSVQWLTENG